MYFVDQNAPEAEREEMERFKKLYRATILRAVRDSCEDAELARLNVQWANSKRFNDFKYICLIAECSEIKLRKLLIDIKENEEIKAKTLYALSYFKSKFDQFMFGHKKFGGMPRGYKFKKKHKRNKRKLKKGKDHEKV